MQTVKSRLVLECLFIFGFFPPALAAFKPHGWMYILLWLAFWLCWHSLARHGYRFREDWNGQVFTRGCLTRILARFIPLSLALGAFTFFMIPEYLFSLPRQKPQVWVMVMLLYPLLSVIPQELVFRSFFFRRYAPLFTTKRTMIIASALAFGWVHILLLNWVAVVFSLFGGLIFAGTYTKTRSLAAVCAEHALYGCMIFTLGLGYYFYHGQAVH